MPANLLPQDGTVIHHGPLLTEPEATAAFTTLITELPWQHDEVRLFGKRIVTARKVSWHGDLPFSYTYSGIPRSAQPWTSTLAAIKTRIEATTDRWLDDDVVELLYPTGGFDEDSFKDRMAALQGCMGKLAPRAYELVMLRYHNDQMPEQIAVTVGWSVNAVRVALSRSRQLLRECLDRRLAVNEVS